MNKLDRSTVDTLPAESRPLVDPRSLQPRIVHFGLGAFHRAHQAVYTEAAAARSGQPWGIVAVAPRSADTVALARSQDGLFSVTDRGSGRTRVVAALTDALHLRDDAAPLDALLASPEITTVTLTITEKGYTRNPATGHLDTETPAVAADLAGNGPQQTVIGRIATSLATRFRGTGAPVNLVSCDNAAGNGPMLATLVRDFVTASPWPDKEKLLDWLGIAVAFPSTVVDRIVPATTPADIEAAANALGVRDGMPVAGESFREWVLEDRFAADRPAWELDGALLVPDAAPYQLRKLRLLNGSHSALAYLGLATGCVTIDDALRTGWGESLVRRLGAEITPTLPEAGLDLPGYVDALVGRFADPGIGHRLSQIGSDGSLKIPERWFDPLRTLESAPTLELALAGWVNATDPAHDFGTTDPAAAALAECWRDATPRTVVARLLTTVGAEDLAADERLVAAVAGRLPAVRAGRVEW
ncbi:mannitol dehydrogenase family protein [Amycolatopsis acidicola]|uniref:mannitol dehydrogenase family protein n=1 Tax=Amycolatopsis acidicola TaxID=2596893 RepID=UPI001FB5FE20|nr:mannitol dehydrogenase family protein [Amycolatopsis acidicola]